LLGAVGCVVGGKTMRFCLAEYDQLLVLGAVPPGRTRLTRIQFLYLRFTTSLTVIGRKRRAVSYILTVRQDEHAIFPYQKTELDTYDESWCSNSGRNQVSVIPVCPRRPQTKVEEVGTVGKPLRLYPNLEMEHRYQWLPL
jgi:hypothetical protein